VLDRVRGCVMDLDLVDDGCGFRVRQLVYIGQSRTLHAVRLRVRVAWKHAVVASKSVQQAGFGFQTKRVFFISFSTFGFRTCFLFIFLIRCINISF
jgi:hypothetical protein